MCVRDEPGRDASFGDDARAKLQLRVVGRSMESMPHQSPSVHIERLLQHPSSITAHNCNGTV